MYKYTHNCNDAVVMIRLTSNMVREGDFVRATLAAPLGSVESSIIFTFLTVPGSATGECLGSEHDVKSVHVKLGMSQMNLNATLLISALLFH